MPEYAEYFVRTGMAVLIFDYRCLGASNREPRQHLNLWKQIADYRSAIDAVCYLDLFKGIIDPERIGVWGISYAGGHSLIVGAIDPRVRCIVSQIPVIEGWYNSMRADGSVGFRELTALVNEGTAPTLPHRQAPTHSAFRRSQEGGRHLVFSPTVW